ncbi:actin [Histomonas meleagridis]|uniref:actin n=1 Tax=Histomonas meleagridis TaxID=135588 RepID=UPI003559B7C1|nr:actin [Histomonas meleagridis]KAH0802586.1 actin [Histomonas meleagridis]
MSSSQLSPNQSVFLIDSLLNPKINRAKMSEIMFEKYNFQYFYSGNQSPIALYSGGRKSGVSVNIGEGTTQIVPVNEGIPIFNAISELNISGIEIKQMFKNFLSDRGYSFNDPTTSIWNTIISNALYVANDYESELTKAKTSHKCDMTIHINETQEITISYERFCCYEQLFRRQINGFNEKGIVDILYDSIMSVDRKERKYFCVNICLFGGSSLVDGLAERIMNELSNKVKKEIGMTIVRSSPERRISSWIGASVFASLPYYEQMYIRKKEYDEYGVSLVLNKCFY